jgi:Dipeptidyl peptidase IV (DPP IV) N-terminal region
VLDERGQQVGGALPRGGTAVIAEIAPDGSHVATIELLPEMSPAPVGSPPGTPGLTGFVPYLFVAAPDGSGRDVVARSTIDTAWLGARLARTDTGRPAPFAVGICLLAVNTSHECERDVARDPERDLFNPAFYGQLAAVVQAPDTEIGLGPIVVYDSATAAPVRTLTSGRDSQPSWSPDGRFVAFARDNDIYVVSATGGSARRVLTGGQQPVWTTAAACRVRRHPPVRVRGRFAIVTACAPQPGRITVTLRSGSRRVARRSVRAKTGGLVTVRVRRPAGRLVATVS